MYIKPVWLFVMGSFTTKVVTLPGQTKHHGQNNRTSNQVNGRESEILTITIEQSIIAIEKKNIASVDRLCNTLKKNVDEVHDLKITVQENRFEAEEDKEGILEWSAQIEEGVGEFEKAINDIELAVREFRSRSKGRRRASRKTKKEDILRQNEVRESQTRAET